MNFLGITRLCTAFGLQGCQMWPYLPFLKSWTGETDGVHPAGSASVKVSFQNGLLQLSSTSWVFVAPWEGATLSIRSQCPGGFIAGVNILAFCPDIYPGKVCCFRHVWEKFGGKNRIVVLDFGIFIPNFGISVLNFGLFVLNFGIFFP